MLGHWKLNVGQLNLCLFQFDIFSQRLNVNVALCYLTLLVLAKPSTTMIVHVHVSTVVVYIWL